MGSTAKKNCAQKNLGKYLQNLEVSFILGLALLAQELTARNGSCALKNCATKNYREVLTESGW